MPVGVAFSLALLGMTGKLTLWQLEAATSLFPGLVLGSLCSRIVHSRLDQNSRFQIVEQVIAQRHDRWVRRPVAEICTLFQPC